MMSRQNYGRKIGNDDWLPIGEFSELVGIPVTTLRFYDKHKILVPEKRGKGKNDDFRQYSPKQITKAKMVKVLREIGIPLADIAELSEARTPDKLIKLFTKYNRVMLYKSDLLDENMAVTKTYKDLIMDGLTADENEITIMPLAEIPIVLGSKTNFAEGDDFYYEYLKFCREPRNPELNLLYPVGGYFESMESFLDHPSRPDRFFSLDPDGNERRERGLYLVGYTRGYYGETNDLPERLAEYAEKHKIPLSGPVYNTYLFDEISMPDSEEYLLQVAVAIDESKYKAPH